MRVRVLIGVRPPSIGTSLMCTFLSFLDARFGAMVPSLLWSLAIFEKGGGGLIGPVWKGGGCVGLNVFAPGLRGFLPLVAFSPSCCPSAMLTGLQLDQW